MMVTFIHVKETKKKNKKHEATKIVCRMQHRTSSRAKKRANIFGSLNEELHHTQFSIHKHSVDRINLIWKRFLCGKQHSVAICWSREMCFTRSAMSRRSRFCVILFVPYCDGADGHPIHIFQNTHTILVIHSLWNRKTFLPPPPYRPVSHQPKHVSTSYLVAFLITK